MRITFPRCSVRDYLAVPASDVHRENIKAAFFSMDQGIWGKTGMCRMLQEREFIMMRSYDHIFLGFLRTLSIIQVHGGGVNEKVLRGMWKRS